MLNPSVRLFCTGILYIYTLFPRSTPCYKTVVLTDHGIVERGLTRRCSAVVRTHHGSPNGNLALHPGSPLLPFRFGAEGLFTRRGELSLLTIEGQDTTCLPLLSSTILEVDPSSDSSQFEKGAPFPAGTYPSACPL